MRDLPYSSVYKDVPEGVSPHFFGLNAHFFRGQRGVEKRACPRGLSPLFHSRFLEGE